MCTTSTDERNVTNDIEIPLNFNTGRVSADGIQLRTIEIPETQMLIESDWNKLALAEGIHFQSNATDPLCNVMIRVGTSWLTAEVPDRLNPVVEVTKVDDEFHFRTKKPHLLGSHAKYWTWGESIELIGGQPVVPLVVGGQLLDTVVVLSPNTFKMTNIPPGPNGRRFVFFPSIPSPRELCNLLTRELRTPSMHARVDYSATDGVYSMTVDSSVCATLSGGHPSSITAYIGFGTNNLRLGGPHMPNTIYAQSRPANVMYIEPSVGNYTPSQLAKELDFQYNRFWLPSDDAHELSFKTVSGDLHVLSIPPGLYTPVTFGHTLTQLFDTRWSSGQVAVVWDQRAKRFSIVSGTGQSFSLEFQLASVAKRMGFDQRRHMSRTAYTSQHIVAAPSYIDYAGCTRFPSTITTVTVNEMSQTFTFNTTRPPVIPDLSVSSDGFGFSHPARAHGYQVGDIVALRAPDHQDMVCFPVSQASSGTEFVLDIDPSLLAMGQSYQTSSHETPISNFLFSKRSGSMPPHIIGFPAVDIMWQGADTVESPFAYRLTGVPYVLLQIVEPNGTTAVEHNFLGNQQSGIMAKIQMKKQPWCDHFPTKIEFSSSTAMSSIRMRLLNPDHSLYRLHGHNWSGTFCLYSNQRFK